MPPPAPRPATVHRTCPLCEAMCGLAIEVEGERVVSIRGDADDPFSRGHLCPKGVALQDVHADPDRLRRPLRRTEHGWEEMAWDDALDLVAERLRDVQRRHGRDAVAVYQGNPTVHNHGTLLYAPGFVRALGTRNRYSATSADQLPHHFAAAYVLGHPLLVPVPDLDRTDFLLVLGANPAVSNGSMMSAPGAAARLKAIRARGGRVLVVDPRRTETAALADRHHFVRPGTDALLLMALLHTLFAEDRARPGRLAAATRGMDELRRAVAGVTPEAAAGPTGIPADEIRALARDFAAAPSAVAYGRFGVSTQEFGAVCQWLILALNLATGNLDRPGGAMLTRPAVDAVALSGRRRRPPRHGRWTSRVGGLPEFGGELPVAALADEILTPGPGQVRALVTSAGNPVLSTPDGRKLERALGGLELMVSVDFYLNETTRHAHVILPPTSPLEHDHYDLAFWLLSIRNGAKLSPAVFPVPPGARHDWEIFLGLRRRLERGWKARLTHAALGLLGPRGLLDLALRTGPHGAGLLGLRRGLTLRRLEGSPHGVDLGPLAPALPGRLRTPDGRIDAAPAPLVADLARVRQRLLAPPPSPSPPADGLDLLLIGRRQLRSNNSWMHNFPRLMRGRDRCTLLVHPADAAPRGLATGDRAHLRTRVGSVEVPVEVSDEVMPGVVSLPHGWGHHRPGLRLAVAAAHPGASANDVTDAEQVDALSGNAVLNGVPAGVEKAAEAPTPRPL